MILSDASPPFNGLPWSLTAAEMAEANVIGERRQSEAVRLGYEEKYGASGGIIIHRIGARGEAVFAKATGLQWWRGVNRPNDPDVGGFEVRTRTEHDYDLIVRPDAKDRPHALVTGTGPLFIVWGWIMAADAKKPYWLRAYGERDKAYFIPKSALRSINEINLPHPPGHWSDGWLDDPEAKWKSLRAATFGISPDSRQ